MNVWLYAVDGKDEHLSQFYEYRVVPKARVIGNDKSHLSFLIWYRVPKSKTEQEKVLY